MEESTLTDVLIKVHNGKANPKDVREFLDQLLSQNLNYTLTWQTIEAFNSILETCTDADGNKELLDVLFDSFNYISENNCNENSWSDFGFELSGLIAKFLRAIQNSHQFGHFFCKLLLAVNYIVKHYQDVWRSVSRLLLNIFMNKKLSFDHLQDSLKLFIHILRNIDSSTLITFAQQNLKVLRSFSMMIKTVGDFEAQVDVLEIIFLHILDNRQLAAEFFFQNQEISTLFQNLNFKRFEVDCRTFINSLNSNLGNERKVFTIKCNQFSLGGQCLELLEEEKCIWFDANIKSKRLSIACSSFDSDTVSFGSRCLIFIPMVDVLDFKAQAGTTSGEDCYCFKISIKDLTQSYQASTSNEMICTALKSCNSEEDIGYFMEFLEFFTKRKELKKSSCTEHLFISSSGNLDEKENPANVRSTEDRLSLPNFSKLNKLFLNEKKLQDNAISSSNNKNKPVKTALDLFKNEKEAKGKLKRKSYGIFIGGGLTEPLVFLHGETVIKSSSPEKEKISSDEGGNLPRNKASSDEGESSPRRSLRLKNKTDVSYCEDSIIPCTAPMAKNKNRSPKRMNRNNGVLSPTELLQEKLKMKISPKVQMEKEKLQKAKPCKSTKKGESYKKHLFSSQENATQKFDDVSSPLEKDLPSITPKKYLDSKGKSPAPRRGKSLPDKTPKSRVTENALKNSSLLDPNGYAFKRWTSGETTERGKFWVEKIKKLEAKVQYESESVYDFSEDESQLFKKKNPKKRGRKKKSDLTGTSQIVSSDSKTNQKSEPKNGRKSSTQKIKKETSKVKSVKTEKKRNSVKPALKVKKVLQKERPKVHPEFRIEAEPKVQTEARIDTEPKNETDVRIETEPKIHTEIRIEVEPNVQTEVQIKPFLEPEVQPEVYQIQKLDPQFEALDKNAINSDPCQEEFEFEVENEKLASPKQLFEDDKAEQLEFLNHQTLREHVFEEVVPPNNLGQNRNTGDNGEKMYVSSDESHGNIRNYDNLILGQASSDDQVNNNIIVKELNLDSIIDPKLPVLKIDIENGKMKIIQTNSKAFIEKHQKETLEKLKLNETGKDETGKDETTVKSVNPCGSLSLNSSTNDTVSSPRVIVNPLKTRKRYRKKKRDMNRRPKRKVNASSSEEEKEMTPPKTVPKAKTDQCKRKRNDLGSADKKSINLPKKTSEAKIQKSKSSDDDKLIISLEENPKLKIDKSKRKRQDVSSEDEKLIISPKKSREQKKQKIEESSEELSEEQEAVTKKISQIMAKFKEKNREKNKAETDRIIETVTQGNEQLLKSLNKKDSSKLGSFTKQIEEVVLEDSFEKDLSKKYDRLEKCVTYFTSGCSVSDINEDMKEFISKIYESVNENNSEDEKKEEEKIERFSTRFEAAIKCQTEAELKNQLEKTMTKMLGALSFSGANFY